MKRKARGLYLVGFLSIIFCLIFGGRLATMQTAEGDSLPPTPAPAAGVQQQPKIARGANSSLVVWSDNRTSITPARPNTRATVRAAVSIFTRRELTRTEI